MNRYKSAYELELDSLDLQLCLETDMNQPDYDGSRQSGDDKPGSVQPPDAWLDAFVTKVYHSGRPDDRHHDGVVKALQNHERFNPDHPWAGAYFGTIKKRVWIDQARRRRPMQMAAGFDKASPEPPPDEMASFAEFRERVRAALAMLPDLERKVIEAKIAQKSVEETASEVGITVREVYALTFRARVKLREFLGMEEA